MNNTKKIRRKNKKGLIYALTFLTMIVFASLVIFIISKNPNSKNVDYYVQISRSNVFGNEYWYMNDESPVYHILKEDTLKYELENEFVVYYRNYNVKKAQYESELIGVLDIYHIIRQGEGLGSIYVRVSDIPKKFPIKIGE